MSATVRPWYACTGDPCTCPKPDGAAQNARRLTWFTDDELRAELERRQPGTRGPDGHR